MEWSARTSQKREGGETGVAGKKFPKDIFYAIEIHIIIYRM